MFHSKLEKAVYNFKFIIQANFYFSVYLCENVKLLFETLLKILKILIRLLK